MFKNSVEKSSKQRGVDNERNEGKGRKGEGQEGRENEAFTLNKKFLKKKNFISVDAFFVRNLKLFSLSPPPPHPRFFL